MSFLSRKHSTPAGRTGLSASGPNSTSRTRLAAVVALVAVIAWLAVVASTVVFEFGDFLLALGSVFGLAFFGWFVLTRRGLVRLLGVPGALLGLAG
jgi:hypothetical protein